MLVYNIIIYIKYIFIFNKIITNNKIWIKKAKNLIIILNINTIQKIKINHFLKNNMVQMNHDKIMIINKKTINLINQTNLILINFPKLMKIKIKNMLKKKKHYKNNFNKKLKIMKYNNQKIMIVYKLKHLLYNRIQKPLNFKPMIIKKILENNMMLNKNLILIKKKIFKNPNYRKKMFFSMKAKKMFNKLNLKYKNKNN